MDIPKGCGFVVRIGWAAGDEGKEVFRAIVEFPNGPPENMTFATVWEAKPVEIREVEQAA